MICEKCKGKMNWSIEGATQGWRCPMCGWNIITTGHDNFLPLTALKNNNSSNRITCGNNRNIK